MSMRTDCVYGFGFLLDGITTERLIQFIQNHRENFETMNEINLSVTQGFDEFVRLLPDTASETEIFEELEDYFEEYSCECSGREGWAAAISNIMSRETGIRFEYHSGDEYNDSDAILFVETYPWHLNKIEKMLTEEILSNTMAKYMEELGLPGKPDHQRMEYFG